MTSETEDITYMVSWSIELDASDPRDAADQAWTMLTDAANGFGPATILVVRPALEDVFDMAPESRGDRV